MRLVPLLAILLLVLVGLPHGFGQGGLSADLEVVSIRVEDAVFNAEEPARVIVKLTNHGPGSGSGVLRFRYNSSDQPLTGDSRSDQPTDVIGPGDTEEFVLPWTPAEAQVGPGTVLVSLTSLTDPDTSNNQARAPVFVVRYAIAVSLAPDGHETFPGRATAYGVAVRNVGNAAVRLNATLQGPTPADWTFEVGQAPSILERGANGTVVVLVTPPDLPEGTLPDGSNATRTLRVLPVENPAAARTLALPNTTVVRDPDPPFVYGVAVRSLASLVHLGRGVPGQAILEVENLGNVHDAFTLAITKSGALTQSLNVTAAQPLLALGPGERARVPIELLVEGDPPLHSEAQVRVEVASVNVAVFEPGAVNETSVTARLSGADLVVTGVETLPAIYQSQGQALVSLALRNDGQAPANATTVELTVLRGGFEFDRLTTTGPALAPGANTTSVLRVPLTNLTGTYDLVARIDPDDEVAENLEDNNARTGVLFVRTAGLALRPADPLDAVPGQFVRYEHPPHVFEVQNLGNAPEVVRVKVTSEGGWVSAEETVRVPAGGRKPVPVSFFVPRLPGSEADVLRVSAQLVNLSTVTASNSTETRILDREPPRLMNVTFPANVTATEPFVIAARFEDAVGVARAALLLDGPTNGTERLDLTPGGNGTFSRNLTVFELGAHAFRFEAVDASATANRFTHTDAFTFEARYDTAPTVVLPEGTGARALRAGVPIPVEIVEPAGVRSVRYLAGAFSGELTPPYLVPTDSWPEGNHTLTVTAVNRYGLEGAASARFAVDNTAPRIVSVRFDPERPAPDASFTVLVETAGGAETGLALFTRAEGDPFTVTLDPRGGHLQGTASLTEGRYTVILETSDAAGNTASREVTLEVGGRSLPGPGWVLVLFVLAGAAVACARRRDQD